MQPQQPYWPQAYPPAPPPPVVTPYPSQTYPAQYAPAYPTPPAYGAPAQPIPTAPGSLDKFYEQPATGAKSWVFKDKPEGTWYAGIVTRPMTDSDVRQQTTPQGLPLTFRDGRPKFVMVVPMTVQPSAEFPDGLSTWWVRGHARDELNRAMAEAGAPAGAPEAGAYIVVQLVGKRPIPGQSPAHVYRVTYKRPVNAQPASPAPAAPAPPIAVAPVPDGSMTAPYQWPTPPAPPVEPVRPGAGAYPPPQPQGYGAGAGIGAPMQWPSPPPPQPAQFMPPTPVPPVNPAAPVVPPLHPSADLDAQQAALLAQLTGQGQPVQ